jgi:DNA-binding transcriptional ArsR family regulator
MKVRRDIFQAIADPTRRDILMMLALNAMTPNGLAEHFNTSRQAVSKHIQILTECEVVTHTHRGREIYYEIEVEKMKDIDIWIKKFRKRMEDRFNQLDELMNNLKSEQ